MVGWFWFFFSVLFLVGLQRSLAGSSLLSVKSLDMDIWLHFFWVDLVGIFTKKIMVFEQCVQG